MEWNKKKLIDFFLENFQKEILIQELDSSFNIQGEIKMVEELDLCSYKLHEVQIIQKKSNIEFYITLHEKFLGIHSEILSEESKKGSNKSRKKIPYYGLSVSLTNKF